MRLDYRLGLTSALHRMQGRWSPARLFDHGAVGAAYSASQGLFQDSAGTIAADAPGHPVGFMRDLSGTGNHAVQTVSSQRPMLGRHPARGLENRLPNNTTDGAATGVLGEGGALPDGWDASFPGGAAGSVEVVTVGADYIDLHIIQTADSPNGAALIRPVPPGGSIPVAQGENWTFSIGLALIDGSLGGNGTVQLRGSERNASLSVIASPTFLNPVPVTATLARYGGAAVIADADTVVLTPDFRVASTGPWDATFRLSLPQLERGTEATNVQIARAGGFDVTEAGQRSLWYLQPDGVDDWMQLGTPFIGADSYTIAAALGGAVNPVLGAASSAAGALRYRTLVAGSSGSRLRADITDTGALVADHPAFLQRHTHLTRASSATQGAVWVNGDPLSATTEDALTPAHCDALFRFGSSFASGRFYGAVMIDDAVSDPDRIRLQHYLSDLAGVSE